MFPWASCTTCRSLVFSAASFDHSCAHSGQTYMFPSSYVNSELHFGHLGKLLMNYFLKNLIPASKGISILPLHTVQEVQEHILSIGRKIPYRSYDEFIWKRKKPCITARLDLPGSPTWTRTRDLRI